MKKRAMVFAAVKTMANTDPIRAARCQDPHLAAEAPARKPIHTEDLFYNFTQPPFLADERTQASIKATPFSPSSTVG